MSKQQRRRFTFLVLSSALMACGGCQREQTAAEIEANVANFNQKLILTIDESSTELALDRLDIFLTDDDKFPETFQLRGPNVIVVGKFPIEIRIGDAENWEALVKQEIPISATGGDPGNETESTVILPGLGKVPVTEGSFTIESYDPGFDAKTPLTGRIQLKIWGPRGEKTIEGTISVLGTTWG